MSTVWTEENIANLKRYVEEGLSARATSERMGNQFSRNAIISKCRRIGVHLKNKPIATVLNPHAPKRHAATTGQLSTTDFGRKRTNSPYPGTGFKAADPIIIAPEMRRLTIIQLRPTTCRWPLGDPLTPDFRYCGASGASMVGGRPYCPYHHSLSYETRQQRAARAALAISRGRFGAAV